MLFIVNLDDLYHIPSLYHPDYHPDFILNNQGFIKHINEIIKQLLTFCLVERDTITL